MTHTQYAEQIKTEIAATFGKTYNEADIYLRLRESLADIEAELARNGFEFTGPDGEVRVYQNSVLEAAICNSVRAYRLHVYPKSCAF